MTTIYILRHSQPFRKLLGNYNANEVEQIRNEKNIKKNKNKNEK